MYKLFLCKFKGDDFLKVSTLEKMTALVNSYKPENWTEFEKYLRRNDPPIYNQYLAEQYDKNLFEKVQNIDSLSIDEYKNKELPDYIDKDLRDFQFKKVTFSESILDINFPENIFEVISFYCNGKSTKGLIDFERYSLLTNIHILSFNSGIKLKNCSKTITQVTLWYYTPKSKTLSDIIKHFPNVEDLIIHHTNIDTLEGINELKRIKNLHIDYGKSLKFVAEINLCTNLNKAIFNNCKKIEDFDLVDSQKEWNVVNLNVPG